MYAKGPVAVDAWLGRCEAVPAVEVSERTGVVGRADWEARIGLFEVAAVHGCFCS